MPTPRHNEAMQSVESVARPVEGSKPHDAGPFLQWLQDMRGVLRGEREGDVPCGDCVGCCVSRYPIPLRPTDTVALARVPEEHVLCAPAPGQGEGSLLMGFREDGTCPMFVGGGCSIYADRPQTCRDYDCRIYSAAGLMPPGDRPVIAKRVSAWQFTYPTDDDQAAANAVLRAATFIQQHASKFPEALRTESPTAVAVLALKCYGLFQDEGEVTVDALLAAAKEFDATPAS
jgi:uncharacterized protein